MPRERLPLAFSIESRTANPSKDARLVNGLIETREEKKTIIKRPGYSAYSLSPAPTAGVSQGIFAWNNYLITGINNNIYAVGGYPGAGVSTLLGTISGTPLPFSYTTVQGDTKLAFHNGTNIYTINKGVSNTGVATVGSLVAGAGYTDGVYNEQALTGGTGTGATALITVAAGAVTSVTIQQEGANYTVGDVLSASLPAGAGFSATVVTLSGASLPRLIPGTGLSGVIQGVTIINKGGFYGISVPCTVASGATTVVTKTAHGLVAGQGIQFTGSPLPSGLVAGTTYQVVYIDANSFSVNSCTSGGGVGVAIPTTTTGTTVYYFASPVVTFSASTGITAKGTAVLLDHKVNKVIVTAAGNNYTTLPTVTFAAPPTPVQATFTITTFNAGCYVEIAGVTITNFGQGYLTPPTVIYPANSLVPVFPCNLSGVMPNIELLLDVNGGISGYSFVSPGLGGKYNLSDLNPPTTIGVDAPVPITATGTVIMNTNGINGPFAVGMAYLDGLCYIMGTDAKVYNSNANDPAIWPGTYLTASNDPDDGVALIKHLNYLVCFGQWSTEFMYDGGNPIGSPLAVNTSAKLEIGCANGYSVASSEHTVIWMGQSLTEGRSIYMLNGLSPVKVSTRNVDNYLNADSLSSVRSYCFKLSGHSLYVLTLVSSNITLVYDLDEKKWYQWTSQSGDTGTVASGTENYFKLAFFSGNIEYTPALFFQDNLTGAFYLMSPNNFDDAGNLIYTRGVTPIADSGTTKRKFYKSVEVVGDKATGTAYIRHSEDDYTTFSPFRAVTLSDPRPILYQLGQGRRSSWEFFHSSANSLRIDALELEYSIGEQVE